MKKIINGKKYDTDTATLLAHWWNGHSSSDFNYCVEDLYRKRTGEFFLFGDGGAMTCWSEHRGNTRCGTCDILPLTEDGAREWVEGHANNKYEEIFGEVAE